jgi:hypothetical protein
VVELKAARQATPSDVFEEGNKLCSFFSKEDKGKEMGEQR